MAFHLLTPVIFLFLMLCSANSFHVNVFSRKSLILGMSDATTALRNIPTTEKARLSLICTGKSIDSAIFRAELKKELTFFRGCSGIYALNPKTNILEVIGEGKTKQLGRFLDWMVSLTTDIATRKPNFQGPSIIIKIDKVKLTDFEGTIKGAFSIDLTIEQ